MIQVFSVYSVMFIIIFAVVIGVFVAIIARGIITWGKNNSSPRIPAEVRIVAKNTSVLYPRRTREFGHAHIHGATSYHVTFEFLSGDRIELDVPSREYGLIAVGDIGTLTFQGTRYISFNRKIKNIKRYGLDDE